MQTSSKIAFPDNSTQLHDKLFLSLRILENEKRYR